MTATATTDKTETWDATRRSLDDLADEIVTLADGMKTLRAGRFQEKALLQLINLACPSTSRPGTRVIKQVLDAIESLPETYLKQEGDEG